MVWYGGRRGEIERSVTVRRLKYAVCSIYGVWIQQRDFSEKGYVSAGVKPVEPFQIMCVRGSDLAAPRQRSHKKQPSRWPNGISGCPEGRASDAISSRRKLNCPRRGSLIDRVFLQRTTHVYRAEAFPDTPGSGMLTSEDGKRSLNFQQFPRAHTANVFFQIKIFNSEFQMSPEPGRDGKERGEERARGRFGIGAGVSRGGGGLEKAIPIPDGRGC